MNVSLTSDLEQMIQDRIATGRYSSASDVVREGLRLLEERDQEMALRKDEIRQQIADGMASLRAGRSADGEAFFAGLDAELNAIERSEAR